MMSHFTELTHHIFTIRIHNTIEGLLHTMGFKIIISDLFGIPTPDF